MNENYETENQSKPSIQTKHDAQRVQEQLLEKYSDVSEARINMIFEEMEANDAPEVVKEGEPEEVAGEAEKEDVLPEEVEGEDVKEAEVE